jgi:hypothetical protein
MTVAAHSVVMWSDTLGPNGNAVAIRASPLAPSVRSRDVGAPRYSI